MAGKDKEISWSLTKARMFQTCPRSFYYTYYLAKAGRDYDAPEEARLAAEMKRLKGLDMWVGEVVHQVIQGTLEQVRNGEDVSREGAVAEAKRLLSSGWRCSNSQEWRKFADDEHPSLFNHYYKLPVNAERISVIKQKTLTSVENFMDSDVFHRIVGTSTELWLPVEKYAAFRLDGLLMYVKFDFAHKDGKQLVVYDWKTGKPSGEQERQLTCYALYTSDKWSVPLPNVKACVVHLQPEIECREFVVDDASLDDLRSYIMRTFSDMVECLRNPARDIAVIDDFSTTDDLKKCLWCNFRGVCEQGQVACGVSDDPVPEEDSAYG